MKPLNIAIGLVVILAVVGGYFYPKAVFNVGSATGSTFSTAKIAMIVFAPATASATTTSVYNGDASDRIIKAFDYNCSSVGTSKTFSTGTGLATFTFSVSTSTSASNNASVNTNYVFNGDVATSTADQYVASTTPGLTTTVAFRRWAAGTYLLISANATNTASCVVGAEYLAT